MTAQKPSNQPPDGNTDPQEYTHPLKEEILSRLAGGLPVGVVVRECFSWASSETFIIDLTALEQIDPPYAGLLKEALLTTENIINADWAISGSQGEHKSWRIDDWNPMSTGVAIPVYGTIVIDF